MLNLPQCSAALHVSLIVLISSASVSTGVRPESKLVAPASTAKMLQEIADMRTKGSNLLFLQLERPSPQNGQTSETSGADEDQDDDDSNPALQQSSSAEVDSEAPDQSDQRGRGGAKPVKKLLMDLEAINQKLGKTASVSDQSDAQSGDVPQASEEPPARGSVGEGADSASRDFDEQPPLAEGRLQELPEADVVSTAPAHRRSHARDSGARAALAMVQTDHTTAGAMQRLGSAGVSFERPLAASGKSDLVHFGLYGRTFYGVDLKEQEYTMDFILTLQWTDARSIYLLQSGQDELTLTSAEASEKLWMPSVEILNRDPKRFDPLSSSVTIAKDGKVTKVERSLVVMKNKFVLDDYPFDKQTLRLSVASSHYMLNELVLVPLSDKPFSGIRKGFFDGEEFFTQDFKVKAYEDIDGSLKKSRGSMEIVVARSLARFQRNFLLPAIIFLGISCAVFWLPFSPTFVTPRLALSIFILLVFSNLTVTADGELPPGAPYNWVDLMCFTIQLHMFTVVCLNIFTEITYHSMKCTITAIQVSNELRVVAPLITTTCMATILAASTNPHGIFDLHSMTLLVPLMFSVFLLTYLTCCGSTLSAEIRRNQHAEKMKSQDYGSGTVGPLASSESLAPAPSQ